MTANASRKRSFVVLSIFLIASPVAAMESTRSLRCVVRKVWRDFEVVELIDRHHVDGAHPFDLGAQVEDHLVRGHRPCRRGARLVGDIGGHRRRRRPRPSAGSGASSTGLGLASRPSASSCATSAATSSSVACTDSTQFVARCERSDSAVARATSSCPASPRTASSDRRASRMRVSCSSNPARRAWDASSAVADAILQLVERAQPGVEPGLGLLDCRDQGRAPRVRAFEVFLARGDARFELARRLFEPRHFNREGRWRARRAPRATPSPRTFAAPGPASLRARQTAGAAPSSGDRPRCAARLRCARSTRAPRPASPPVPEAVLRRSGARSQSVPACG